MADDITAPLTGDGDPTAELRFVELATGQKVGTNRLDQGIGTAESIVSTANPLRVSSAPTLVASPNVDGTPVSVGTGAPVTVLAAFATRTQATLIPEGDVYMRLNGAAANTHAKLPAYTPYNISGYSGSVSMLSVSGTINVNVWEF